MQLQLLVGLWFCYETQWAPGFACLVCVAGEREAACMHAPWPSHFSCPTALQASAAAFDHATRECTKKDPEAYTRGHHAPKARASCTQHEAGGRPHAWLHPPPPHQHGCIHQHLHQHGITAWRISIRVLPAAGPRLCGLSAQHVAYREQHANTCLTTTSIFSNTAWLCCSNCLLQATCMTSSNTFLLTLTLVIQPASSAVLPVLHPFHS